LIARYITTTEVHRKRQEMIEKGEI